MTVNILAIFYYYTYFFIIILQFLLLEKWQIRIKSHQIIEFIPKRYGLMTICLERTENTPTNFAKYDSRNSFVDFLKTQNRWVIVRKTQMTFKMTA